MEVGYEEEKLGLLREEGRFSRMLRQLYRVYLTILPSVDDHPVQPLAVHELRVSEHNIARSEVLAFRILAHLYEPTELLAHRVTASELNFQTQKLTVLERA